LRLCFVIWHCFASDHEFNLFGIEGHRHYVTGQGVREGQMIDEKKLAEWQSRYEGCYDEMDRNSFDEIMDTLSALWKENAELKHQGKVNVELFDEVKRQRLEIEELKRQAEECGCWQGHGRGSRCAKLEAVARAAEGLSHGVDWNKGTHAIIHGYRKQLLEALAAIKDKP
jgi:hypothetical protein